MSGIAWAGSRSWKIVAGTVVTMLLIGYFGMWEDTMKTISMIFVCTVISIVRRHPIGIADGALEPGAGDRQPDPRRHADHAELRLPDPGRHALGIGKVPGLIAVVIYAMPPMIRLTNLGIRLVDKEMLEAADAFGSSGWQKLKNVQLPLALPTIMAGHQPDHHDGAGHGRHRLDDRGAGSGPAGAQGDLEPVFHAGHVQRLRHRRHRHHLRPRQPGLSASGCRSTSEVVHG
jgi:hypothetical protein